MFGWNLYSTYIPEKIYVSLFKNRGKKCYFQRNINSLFNTILIKLWSINKNWFRYGQTASCVVKNRVKPEQWRETALSIMGVRDLGNTSLNWLPYTKCVDCDCPILPHKIIGIRYSDCEADRFVWGT